MLSKCLKYVLLTTFLCLSYGGYAQRFKEVPTFHAEDPLPIFYLGLGNGINTYTGILGAALEVPLPAHLSAFVAGGLGGWGLKLGGGVKFYFKDSHFGSALDVGFANAFGGNNLELNLELAGSSSTQKVVMNLYNAGTLNFGYSYNIKMGRRVKFVVGAGWALAVVDQPYELVAPRNAKLSDSSIAAMKLSQPGGLFIAATFYLGVN